MSTATTYHPTLRLLGWVLLIAVYIAVAVALIPFALAYALVFGAKA